MTNILNDNVSKRLNDILDRQVKIPIQNIFKDNSNVKYISLTTPLKIKITKEKSKELTDLYLNNEEIGGWLFLNFNQNDIFISDIVIVKNISEDKLNSYKPDPKEDIFKLETNIIRNNEFYYPVRFHTHPFINGNLIGTNFNTSLNDQELAVGYVKYGSCCLCIPNALITKVQSETLLFGIFGGNIAPDNFFKEKLNRMSNGISNLVNFLGVKNENWNYFVSNISSLFLEMKFPGIKDVFVNKSVNIFNKELSNYFIQLSIKWDVFIDLPLFKNNILTQTHNTNGK